MKLSSYIATITVIAFMMVGCAGGRRAVLPGPALPESDIAETAPESTVAERDGTAAPEPPLTRGRIVVTWDCGADSGTVMCEFDESGTLWVSGKGAMRDYYFERQNISPSPWHDISSTKMCSVISAVIEDSVMSIGHSAFAGCSDLTFVIVGDNIKEIGAGAFLGCKSLKTVTIPNGVLSIGTEAFYGCESLKTVTIPNSVISIEERAFYSCTGLMSIYVGESNANYSSRNGILFSKTQDTLLHYPAGIQGAYSIPVGVKTVAGEAFSHCAALTSITIPNTVAHIEWKRSGEDGHRMFYGCTGLTSINVDSGNLTYSSIDGMLFNNTKDTLIFAPVGIQGAYSIPANVVTIGDLAFEDCKYLTSVTVPNTVMSIGEKAFYGCSALAFVTISNGVARIGDYAFYGCVNLKDVTVPNSVTYIGEAAFSRCKSLMSATIGNGVASIKEAAFSGCESLVSVTIPNSVISISDRAFRGCERLSSITLSDNIKKIGRDVFAYSGLTSVTIPGSVKVIETQAFLKCFNLKSVTIMDGVTAIENTAFRNTALTSITIPGSVETIGYFAFYGCRDLKTVIVQNSTPPKVDRAFEGKGCLYVPEGSIDAYRAAEGWKEFKCIEPLASAPKGE